MLKPDAKFASIVLLGNFNPSIFHPQWFAAHDIISKTEADDETDQKITTPQIASFSLTWGNVQVTANQFVIKGKNPTLFMMLNDFVRKTFSVLSHTPVSAMGINLEQKWLPNKKEQHSRFGDNIVPKGQWGFMTKPGLRDIIMEDQQRPDERTGYIQARIQALNEKPDAILISINDHYVIRNYDTSMGAEPIMSILEANWEISIARSEEYIQHIIKNFS